MPINIYNTYNSINKIKGDYFIEYGHNPTIEIIARKLKSQNKINCNKDLKKLFSSNAVIQKGHALSLDNKINIDNNIDSFYALIEDKTQRNPLSIIIENETYYNLYQALNKIGKNASLIICLFYGLYDGKRYKIPQISKMLHMENAQIYNMKRDGIKKLRKYLRK